MADLISFQSFVSQKKRHKESHVFLLLAYYLEILCYKYFAYYGERKHREMKHSTPKSRYEVDCILHKKGSRKKLSAFDGWLDCVILVKMCQYVGLLVSICQFPPVVSAMSVGGGEGGTAGQATMMNDY